MPDRQEAIDLKQLRLYPIVERNSVVERQILSSGNSAALMWANGLGSTQTTPSTSAQAVPTPILVRDTQLSTFFAWLRLTNHGMERPYDC
jgi:hypothetical protein